DIDDDIDDIPELALVMNRRLLPAGKLARALGSLLVAPVLARQEAAGKRAPHQDAEPLVERDRQELVFRFAGLKGVVDLLCDEARQMLAFGNAERLHEMPAG